MIGSIGYAAAFLAGFSGSLHCLAMCGGISGALGMRARAHGRSPATALLHSLLYQGGRIASYALAGALCGAFGAWLLSVFSTGMAASWVRASAGLVMVMLGTQLLLGWRLLAPIERLGYAVWRRISPHLHSAKSRNELWQSILLGAAWGWLPCGLVYSMLLLGVLGATPLQGAGIMVAFGLGTLPMMLGSSLLASQLARLQAQRWRALGGISLLALGIWTMSAAFHAGH